MHEMSVFWLRVAAALYAVGLLHAILTVLSRRIQIFRAALTAFVVGVVLHFVSLVELTYGLGHLPVNNFFESISLCGFLIAALFLFIYWRYEFTGLGVFLFPLVFLMTLAGSMAMPVAPWSSSQLRDAWLLVHVLLVLSGYAALLFTAVASVFYLIQEKHLKSKRPRAVLFDRLPPLATLDNMVTTSMNLGFVLITLSVIAGITWAFVESGTRWIGEAKITISLLTWGSYLLMVFLRMSTGLRGRKAALMVVTVLGCLALTWATHLGLRSLLTR
jgi:ABC-type uncharacterized transport system, permease component